MLKHVIRLLLAGGVAAGALSSPAAVAAEPDSAHAVFVMTNDALHNEVVAYPRTSDGTLLSLSWFQKDIDGPIEYVLRRTLKDEGRLKDEPPAGEERAPRKPR